MSKRMLIVTLLFGCAAQQLFAQQPVPPDQTKKQTSREATANQMERQMVEFFASKLVLCNNAEIKGAQMAIGKATNNEVKQFANMMAKEHAAANEQLRPFLADYSPEPITSTGTDTTAIDRDQAKKPADRGSEITKAQAGDKPAREQTETSFREASAAPYSSLFEVCESAHAFHMEQCKEMLGAKTGAEFDKAFIGSQVAAHMAILAELKALEKHSGGEFQSLVREMKNTVDGHLKTAIGICEKIGK